MRNNSKLEFLADFWTVNVSNLFSFVFLTNFDYTSQLVLKLYRLSITPNLIIKDADCSCNIRMDKKCFFMVMSDCRDRLLCAIFIVQ